MVLFDFAGYRHVIKRLISAGYQITGVILQRLLMARRQNRLEKSPPIVDESPRHRPHSAVGMPALISRRERLSETFLEPGRPV